MGELVFGREFTRVARWAADRPALIDHGTGVRTTFGEHHRRVALVSGALDERLGLRPGDRYAALMDNRTAYAELWHAGLCGAGLFTSVNSRVSADELRHTLSDAGSRVVFTSAPFAEMIEKLRPELPELERVVLVGGGDVPHDVGYDELLDGAPERLPDPPREDDPCVLLYTGGTTGAPRGVVLDQRAVMLNWRRSIEVLRPTPRWSFLQVVPMYHIAALMPLLKVHLAGASIDLIPRWDPARALDLIESQRLGALAVVPTMVAQLLEHPAFAPERISSLRYVGYGTAPMPTGLLRRLLDALPDDCQVCQSYGMTEMCGVITMLDEFDHRSGDPELLASAGRPLAGVELSIRDPASEGGAAELPVGDTGEIWATCDSALREYLGRPQETSAVLDDGWYRTGDMGRVDERGYLWVVDRVKDMIVSGGENVYSVEVENAISTMPGVARVAVVGREHPVWGEAVHAVVQRAAGTTFTAEDVRAHAAATLSGYKVPRTVEVRDDELPVSAAGKVLKRSLR